MKKIFPTKYLPKERKQIYSFVLFTFLMLFLFLVDLLTKLLIFKAFDDKGFLKYSSSSAPVMSKTFTAIPGLFDMTLVFNNGAAWNMLADQKWFLSIISLIASIVILYVYIFYYTKLKTEYKIALVLMFAGCFGNLIDRFGFWMNLYPYKWGVIDFIQFHFWKSFPVFNFADSYLVIGIIILAISYVVNLILQAKNSKKVIEEEVTNNTKDDDLLTKLKDKDNKDE